MKQKRFSKILSLLLVRQELRVTEIAEEVGVSQSGVSHQLRLLKQMHLIKFRRDGKNWLKINAISSGKIRPLKDIIYFASAWDPEGVAPDTFIVKEE